MTSTFTPPHWAAYFRAAALVAGVVGMTACQNADRLGPIASDDASTAATEAPVAFVTGNTAQGIAFGPYNLPNTLLGSTYTGAIKAAGPGDILGTLAAARRVGARIMVRLSAGDRYWLNDDHTVNLEKWMAQVARFKTVNIEPYIADGTLMGHMLIDEPHDASNWGGKPVPFATLEAMAKYSKQLWPELTTVVRSYSPWLAGASFRWNYLDANMAQYSARKGEISGWLSNEAAAAKEQGLGLIVSLNVLDGGDRTGLVGYHGDNYSMSASQLKSWGTLLATHPQSCGFFFWDYNAEYLGRSDVKSALAYVASQAKNRNRPSCRAGGEDSSPESSVVAASSITLRVAGRVSNDMQYMILDWSGAQSSSVDVYRNGVVIATTPNDGHYGNTRKFQGPITYAYKVCQNGTSRCSNTASVSFR